MAALDSRRKRWWGLYALAITAAVYSHYTAVLVLAPQAAWALWAHRDRWREQLLATGAAALLFLPWLPSFVVQAENSADEARRIAASVPLTLSNVAELGPRALVGHPFVPFQDLPGWGALLALAAVVAGTVLVAIYRLATGRARLRPSLSSRGTLLLLLAVGPFWLLLAYSLRPETSFLLGRNLSVSVPYTVLLVGWLLTLPGGRLRIALPIIALALVSVGTLKMLTPDYQRPDAKDAAEYIDAEAPPGAPITRRVHLHRPPGSGDSRLSGATPPCLLRRLERGLAARCTQRPTCVPLISGGTHLRAPVRRPTAVRQELPPRRRASLSGNHSDRDPQICAALVGWSGDTSSSSRSGSPRWL